MLQEWYHLGCREEVRANFEMSAKLVTLQRSLAGRSLCGMCVTMIFCLEGLDLDM